METSALCPKLAKCPIYQKNVFVREGAGTTYRNLYCEKGEKRFSTCKRYIVSEKTGRPAPDSIMPNSLLSIDEIIAKM
jgi:hypothetical protein